MVTGKKQLVAAASRPLRAVIYTRVSSDRDGGGRSVSQQEEACRRDCERNGWTVVQVLTENDRGASRWSRKERPEYQKLVKLVGDGAVDIIVTWEASRSNRDLGAYALMRDLCAGSGVLWCYDSRVYDLSDDDDRYRTGMDALDSEREAAKTRKRVLRDTEYRARTGRPHGRLHDGLRSVYDPRTGRPIGWELDPDRAPIMREIGERLLAGESAYAIAADLNARGITTAMGKVWRGGNIVSRMRSPTLAGKRIYRGKVLDDVEGQYPAIFTTEEHARLLAVLADPRRRDNKEGNRTKWLGGGIYRCGVCGAPVRTSPKYRKDRTRRMTYECAGRFCVSRSAELTDKVVETAVVRFLSRPDVMAELIDQDDTAQKEAAAEVAQLKAELVAARQKVRDREITLDDFAFFRDGWETQLKDAERRARPAWVPSAVDSVAGPGAEARWKAQPITIRRSIVKALFAVRVHKVGPGNDAQFDPTAIEVTRRADRERRP